MTTRNVVAIVAGLVVMAGASVARADQCSVVTEQQALDAARYLGMFGMGGLSAHMCELCGDEHGTAVQVTSIEYRPWEGSAVDDDEYEVLVNGQSIDLAYYYITAPDSLTFHNLGELVGCETVDTSHCVDNLLNPIDPGYCEVTAQSPDDYYRDYVLRQEPTGSDDGSVMECNDLIANVGEACLTDESFQECLDVADQCSGHVELLESCPVQFSCGADGAADGFGDDGAEDLGDAGSCSVASQGANAPLGLMLALALGLIALRRRS